MTCGNAGMDLVDDDASEEESHEEEEEEATESPDTIKPSLEAELEGQVEPIDAGGAEGPHAGAPPDSYPDEVLQYVRDAQEQGDPDCEASAKAIAHQVKALKRQADTRRNTGAEPENRIALPRVETVRLNDRPTEGHGGGDSDDDDSDDEDFDADGHGSDNDAADDRLDDNNEWVADKPSDTDDDSDVEDGPDNLRDGVYDDDDDDDSDVDDDEDMEEADDETTAMEMAALG